MNKTKTKTKIKLSQSLLKQLAKYKNGQECGKLIEARYIDKIPMPSSDAMELGCYFEYLATGTKKRDGSVPEPKTLKSGNLSVGYQRVTDQVENYKRIIESHEFKVLDVDVKVENEKYSGLFDVVAEKDGKKCILDLKTTSLINDKWHEFGWSDESIEYKDGLMVQAIQYVYLAQEVLKWDDVDFYFVVFSTTNDWECRIYKVVLDEDTLIRHANNIENAYDYLQQLLEQGFEAVPSYLRCYNCPLKAECQSKYLVPEIKTVYV